MSLADISGPACPACVAGPLAAERGRPAAAADEIQLAVPGVHCAACISTIERGLMRRDGVADARVNLTLRRVRVRHHGRETPESLTEALKGLGYEAMPLDMIALSATEADRASRDLLMRLGVAFFAMMNVMLLSVAVWSGAEDATRDVFHWVSAAIALPTVAFAGQPFFRSAWASLRAGRLGMDVPISLALILACGMSLSETAMSGEHAYFDAAVMLTFFLLGGRYLDHRTRAVARSAAQELAALEVRRALRLAGAGTETVAVADLRPGDRVRVLPGARMPVDGTVEDGASELDRSLLTGESLPARIAAGGAVSAGEVNLTGALTVRVTAAGRDSSLARMADLVAVAESARSRYASLADRAARAYAPLVHTLAAAALVGWFWVTGELRTALNIASAVLIITCPCALGLAVPAVVTAASGRLFRRGLLIKDGTALERLAEVDTVVFDKTGTLTLGTPRPVNLDELPEGALPVAAALAAGSAHPLARAVATAAEERGVVPALLTGVKEVAGHGVDGLFDGVPVRLGRADWVGASAGARTSTWLRIGTSAPVEIAFADRPRPGAADLVQRLTETRRSVMLLSGDVAPAVRDFADSLGLADWRAGLRPEEKAAIVEALVAEGRRVLMVGDGLNDTAALAAATVSISPASALDAARVASDIVLLGEGLAPVGEALGLARVARRRILENFWISGAYNVVAIPLALMGVVTPLIAAAAMSLSSITVTLNALRLRP
ncbi:heavy metal translocating P-type ATPase [Wenxinia marina]|uniref:Copper-, silver-or heavy metal-translocating P-type ATPase n=1 Tax=Wenxinia marina DSM 24838 TaxID=1123501 RepID=A0A0D0NRR2_9RHOB|nr:heavy metal translocating P-type ATPase [Wenxinia marina]KIQ70930.1 copper-, silver- or heavy metal-translocating P-type ATPase [Wenxinia marina DSM 24838]GGL56227.1 copper-translocating P-type ATPase [Wenxinia marina]